MRNKTIVVIVLFILVVVGIYIFYPSDNVKSVDTNDLEEETEEVITKIKVDIKGAIKSPGVYEVDSDKRVTDQTTPNMIQKLNLLFARKPLISKEI